jgi:C-terminal processing protease CtpA/Prc
VPVISHNAGGGSARICTKRDTYPDGKEFVGYGVKPDIEIPRNVNDVINGTDTEMKVALEKLGVGK